MFIKRLKNCVLFALFILSACAPKADLVVEDAIENLESAPVGSDSEIGSAASEFDVPNNLNDAFQNDLANLEDAPIYTLDITLDKDGDIFRVTGTERVRYTNTAMFPLDDIYFKLIPNVAGDYLAVSAVSLDGQPVEPQLEYENTVMRLDLNSPLASGQSIEISMNLDIVVPTEMGGNYGLYIYMDDILALDAFFPIIPVFNDEGWNVEAPPQNADVIFSEAAFFSVTVDAPKNYIIAAAGEEVDRREEITRQIVTYQAGPQREFYLAASPRFSMESASMGDVTVTSYFPEEYRDAGEMVLDVAASALEIFSDRFGAYPYSELDLVSTPMQAGGMEYSSITALGLFYYDPETLIRGAPGTVFLESAVAHETAHMWFYSQVMNDQIDHPWQDESLVQYATYLYFVDRYGEGAAEGFKQSLYDRWDYVEREAIPIGKPAPAYVNGEYSAIIYGRGALMFADLEEQMGSEIFNQFLQDYVDEFRWQIVEPRDLTQAAEQACDCDLSAIFYEYGIDG